MKSQVVMKLLCPHPPCPFSHFYPFALPILSFPSSKRTLTAARKSERVTVECSFAWPRSISTLWLERLYGTSCFVHYEFYMKSLAMIIMDIFSYSLPPCPPLQSPLFPSTDHFPFLLPRQKTPLTAARESEGTLPAAITTAVKRSVGVLQLPQRVRAEPGRQLFYAFQSNKDSSEI